MKFVFNSYRFYFDFAYYFSKRGRAIFAVPVSA